MKIKLTTCLVGLKRNWWRKNLRGYFVFNGRELTDAEVRKVVEYGISKGYETEADIPDEELKKLLGE